MKHVNGANLNRNWYSVSCADSCEEIWLNATSGTPDIYGVNYTIALATNNTSLQTSNCSCSTSKHHIISNRYEPSEPIKE
jgi:hypothetical protein